MSLGPPRVALSWRNWAHWTGPYKGRTPTGELLEMYGMAAADENLEIKSIDVHYDPNQILMTLEWKKIGPKCVHDEVMHACITYRRSAKRNNEWLENTC